MTRAPLLALSLAVLTSGTFAYVPSHPKSLKHQYCPVPLNILWGIAAYESGFNASCKSKDGLDVGMFQLRSKYDRERGVKNALDPQESVSHAIRILYADRMYLKSWDRAITAYNRGRVWVKKHGIDRAYVARVRHG